MAPPPGLPHPGMMSIWHPPCYDFPVLQQQQVTPPPCRPPLGRGEQLSEQLKAIQSRRAQGLQSPQLTPIHQPLLYSGSRSATPYKQLVQPPVKATGPRVSFASSTKPAPTGSQNTQERGRSATKPATRGCEESRTRSDNHSRGASTRRLPHQVCGHSSGPSHKPPAASISGNPSQWHGAAQAPTKNPLENLTQHKSAGWKKDLDYYMGAYLQLNHPSAPEVQ